MKYSGYVITFIIEGSIPSIWRKVEIPANINFYEMHKIIQAIFGWSNKKEYSFFFKEDIEICDTRKEGAKILSLCKSVWDVKMLINKVFDSYNSCKYIYKESWEVNLSIQGILNREIKEIKCIDGQYSSPPEETVDIYNYYFIACKCNDKRYLDYKKSLPLQGIELQNCASYKSKGLCINNYSTELINDNLYKNFI